MLNCFTVIYLFDVLAVEIIEMIQLLGKKLCDIKLQEVLVISYILLRGNRKK